VDTRKDTEDLAAIKEAIDKWWGFYYAAVFCRYDLIRVNHHTCPLCRLYWQSCCKGCPIYLKTRKGVCERTPVKLINDYVYPYTLDPSLAHRRVLHHSSKVGLLNAIAKMIALLEGLLPEDSSI
jgi:hypothetical protein